MKHKFLSSFLCLALTATALTGCGKGSEEPKSTPTPAPTKAPSTDDNKNNTEDEKTPDATKEPDGQENETNNNVPQGEPTVIKWGHNWIPEIDTNYRDPVTGESSLSPESMQARLYAEQQVLEKYNCVIQFVQYPSDVTEIILQSVLANDPVADIVRITNGSQGQILSQNVLQPLDDYASLFEDEDDEWIYWGKVYGHNYFLNNVMRFGANDLLCYNIGMLNKVETLKVDGKTKYPADYFAEGTWTWSVFEDYLQKVNDYFKQEWDGYYAYQTDYRAATLQAIYANGGEVYGDNGLGISSDQTKEAVAFIDRMIQKGLVFSENQYNNNADVVGVMDTWRFQWGHTAFVNLPQWLAGDMVGQFADRGDAMGVVPFPRPDSMAADDPAYRQLNDATDCYAVPKGLSPEKTELVVKVFKEYTQSYYKKLANSDKAMDFLRSDSTVRNEAVRLNLDITNEEYGENILNAFRYLVTGDNAYVNDYSKNAGIYEYWSHDILGYSYYGIEGSPKYSVQVEARKGIIDDLMSNYQAALSGTEINDNVKPKFEKLAGDTLTFPAGTDPNTVDWASYMKASDNIDGELNMANAAVDFSGVDFNAVGKYDGKVVYSIKDASDNEGTATLNIIVYNGNNTTPPTLVLKSEYRTVGLDEDVSSINWKDDFVEQATDADGLDIKNNITPDLSELDTTTPGEYNVEITLKDYAGNETKEVIVITVEKK